MCQDALDQASWDAVDVIVEQWRKERPDLDPSAKHVSGRIVRLATLLEHAYGQALAPVGIDLGAYSVLVALRRAGAPYQLTPTELTRHRLMTSGGMTALIDRLERRGLVSRSPNPTDRRGSLIRLTDEGRAVIDQAMQLHEQAEHRQLEALDDGERDQLTNLLRKLLLAVDSPVPTRSDETA